MKRLLPARLLAALRREAEKSRSLPDEVVRESRRRVRLAALLGSLAYAILLALETSGAVPASALEHLIDVTHDITAVLLCALLFLVSTLPRLSDRTVLRIALVFEVLLCTLISIAVPWAASIRTGHLPGHTWAVSVMILFSLLVPARPWTSFVASSLCAASMPAGILVLDLTGRIKAAPGDYWSLAISGLISLGIATTAARAIYQAGRQFAAAQAVNGYELTETIGRGGAGEVWKARHLLLSRAAAGKLILPEALTGPRERLETALARFTHEAQVISDLRSPHTVQLYDFGSTATGSLYFVMELLDGMNLQHFVYQFGAVEPRRAVRWLRQACHSLGEAHARGLVHRDIKPNNLFVCRYGRELDHLKVLDFGISKPVASTDLNLTAPGTTLGTPGYMAPEQIYGLPVTPATDLYALGCVAYWLLAGATPFESASVGEMIRMHAQAPPPPLSSRARQPIPAPLEELVMRCLAKDPADRPETADRLDAELASVDSVPWTAADARAWWAEHLTEKAPDSDATLALTGSPAPDPQLAP